MTSRSPQTSSVTPTGAAAVPQAPAVLSFFILHCDDKNRTAKSLFQEEIVKPSPGSRNIGLEDFQNVVRDLVVNQELFDSMMRPVARPTNGPLPQGRSFKCLRGATFALHQYCSGTGVRFFLMTDPNYNSSEAQRKLSTIYSGPFLDLVCRSESVSLRDILNLPPKVMTAAEAEKDNNSSGKSANNGGGSKTLGNNIEDDAVLKAIIENDQPPRLVPVLPNNIQQALKMEVLAILRGS